MLTQIIRLAALAIFLKAAAKVTTTIKRSCCQLTPLGYSASCDLWLYFQNYYFELITQRRRSDEH